MITGLFWPIFIFCALGVFLILMVYRIIMIIRQPVHLRWELAPIPYGKVRDIHNNSHFEEYGKQHKKQQKSLTAIIVYMAGEIFLQKRVWKNNRALWPFTSSLHIGIYLVILSMLFHVINALLIISNPSVIILDSFKYVAATIALAGYLVGCLGAIGLILKRLLDGNLRQFTNFSMYFKLLFLSLIFVSGIFAWFYSADFAGEMSIFTRDVFTLNTDITLTTPLAVHIIVSFLFVVYLPLTDMAHFITKFFTYHDVLWDDTTLNKNMELKLDVLKSLTSNWSADHAKKDSRNKR
jgi:nitrate reductase gamma subunit